ncbi:MAG: TolC family protein [Pirellulales bacterium]
MQRAIAITALAIACWSSKVSAQDRLIGLSPSGREAIENRITQPPKRQPSATGSSPICRIIGLRITEPNRSQRMDAEVLESTAVRGAVPAQLASTSAREMQLTHSADQSTRKSAPPQATAQSNEPSLSNDAVGKPQSRDTGSFTGSDNISAYPPDIPSLFRGSRAFPVSLNECIQVSIQCRRIFNSAGDGVVVEQLTAYEPQINDQAVVAELSRFDPTLNAFLAGNHIDRPANSFFGPGLQQSTRIDEGEFNTRLSKVWPLGTTTSVGYEPSLAYLFFPLGNGSGFNPTHSSDLVLRVNQPLLRGGNKAANLATIRIAEQRSMQSRFQVEAAIQAQLRSIEQVYWKLHADHVRIRAIDEAITLAWRTKEISRLRVEADQSIYSDLARVTVKLEDLYQQRLSAEQSVQKSSFELSQLVGYQLQAGLVLVPIDNPEHAQPALDPDQLVGTAMAGNLDLKRQRIEIDLKGTLAGALQNQRLPQLDLQALHRTSGLDNDLGSSLHQMIGYEFNDYTLGLQYSQQLGTRLADSKIRAAQLQTAREAELLRTLERKVGFEVLTLATQVDQAYQTYASAVRQLAQAQKWVELAQLRYEDPPISDAAHDATLVNLVDYQTALQAKVDAIVQVAQRLSEYNALLATVEEKRGNMLQRWNIAVNAY